MALSLSLITFVAACGGASSSSPSGDHGSPAQDSGASSTSNGDDAAVGPDDASAPIGSGQDGEADAAGSSGALDADVDAAPRNAACTPLSQQTGTAVNTSHGRLDGTLVFVLPVGGSGKCNGDDSHVHLQIEVSGSVYDVAVDIGATGDEVGLYTTSIAVPGGAWSEGWHGTDTLSYPSLGLKSSEFPIQAPTDVASQVESLLESTSKISIFCTGYTPGDNGCHDVHYENGNGEDGAIILDPTSATSTVLFFRFQAQSF